MTDSTTTASLRPPAASVLTQILGWLDRLPYTLLAIPLRFALATVFWKSGMTKLSSWETTVALFADEYRVPLLPPELAAYMAASVELTTPVLLIFGFLTRPAAATLLGMTAVIQIFVYPQSWPIHIQWAAMLLILLARGPGKISVDWLIRHRLLGDK